jgi:hypothetical protein
MISRSRPTALSSRSVASARTRAGVARALQPRNGNQLATRRLTRATASGSSSY